MIQHLHDIFEKHKHLWLAGLAGIVILLVSYKIIAHLDNVAHDNRVLAEAQLKNDQKAQKAADDQAKADRLAYDQVKAQLDSQNRQLSAQIIALAASLRTQQAKDKELPPTELAMRWESLVGLNAGDVKAVPDGLIANLDASRKTVILLEEIPSDRDTISKQEKLLGNKDTELSALAKRAESAEANVEACKKTQVSQDAACKAEIAEVKAKARKRSVWYAIGSFIAGILVRSKI